jgi:hypothetical protein
MIPTPIIIAQHRVAHYTERLGNAKSFEEKIWLRKELYNAKQYYNSLLN